MIKLPFVKVGVRWDIVTVSSSTSLQFVASSASENFHPPGNCGEFEEIGLRRFIADESEKFREEGLQIHGFLEKSGGTGGKRFVLAFSRLIRRENNDGDIGHVLVMLEPLQDVQAAPIHRGEFLPRPEIQVKNDGNRFFTPRGFEPGGRIRSRDDIKPATLEFCLKS